MRRDKRHILSAALIVAVWLATPILSVFHIAFEEHSYCAEHESLEEGPSAHASDARPNVGGHDAAFAGSKDTPEPNHEECAFGESFTRDTISVDQPCFAEIAHTVSAPPAPPIASDAGPAIPLLLAAPKSSPPHAA